MTAISAPFDADLFNQSAPEGLFYDPARGLIATGMVARHVLTHQLAPRPGRTFPTCKLDYLGGNSTLGIHLSEMRPLESKCRHRQLDETITLILSGRGQSEYRQADDAETLKVDWQAGDLYSIPCNAWHLHSNVSDSEPTRKIAFKTGNFIGKVLYGKNSLYDQDIRFPDRFDDEPDYYTRAEELAPNRLRANIVRSLADQPAGPVDAEYGEGVSVRHYDMTGQRVLDVSVLTIAPGGFVWPHRSLAEEAFFVLSGAGRTDIWREGGVARSIAWRAGDVVAPPFDVWRSHSNTGTEDLRLLRARNVFLERALGVEGPARLGTVLPDRFPTLLEPGRPV
ncbi:cupin domain-containing protein [Jiangella ureilytica]|uniref:Cupin domain-containing protein n=1 Tax=Jiangella ureilytica TaxID=2530374 RepID=A0A4R4RV92_9ACTN|nr:cupin domain-containing protein [Jiangella ureilytica]TDC52782.1 cupin domain-containing protein [Jiangella ureilytica]